MLAAIVCVGAVATLPGPGPSKTLSQTPPMGWMAWERFRCTTNCTLHPDGCINEALFKRVADTLLYVQQSTHSTKGFSFTILV